MQTQARRTTYIWITTLAKYLAAPNACGYAAWYPSHYRYTKPAFDNPQWQESHQELVEQQAEHLRDLGYHVTTENENDVRLRGPRSGTVVAGQPDLVGIAQQHGRATIRECKTGVARPEHLVQARLYLLLVRSARPELTSLATTATVVYATGAETAVSAVDDAFRLHVREAVAALGAPVAAQARPSLQNCRFCTVPDCAVRVDPEALALDNHDLFE
jgi:hypothetical protein